MLNKQQKLRNSKRLQTETSNGKRKKSNDGSCQRPKQNHLPKLIFLSKSKKFQVNVKNARLLFNAL